MVAYFGSYDLNGAEFSAEVRSWKWNTDIPLEKRSDVFSMLGLIDFIVMFEGCDQRRRNLGNGLAQGQRQTPRSTVEDRRTRLMSRIQVRAPRLGLLSPNQHRRIVPQRAGAIDQRGALRFWRSRRTVQYPKITTGWLTDKRPSIVIRDPISSNCRKTVQKS